MTVDLRTTHRFGACLAACLLSAGFWAGSAAAQDPEDDAHAYGSPAEKRAITDFVLGDGWSVGALIEVEASVGEENGEAFSDIVLATFAFGIEAAFDDTSRDRDAVTMQVAFEY